MAGPADEDHIQVVPFDDPIQMDIDEIQSRRRAPMTQQARLDVLDRQGLPQQGIVEQIDLSHREIVGGPPIGIHLLQ